MSSFDNFLKKYGLKEKHLELLRKLAERMFGVEDGGTGSGNWGHSSSNTRQGKRGGSDPRGATEYVGKVLKGVRELRDNIFNKMKKENKGDGTYTLEGNPVSFKSGYQVAFQTTSSEDPDSEHYISDEQYDELVNKLVKETGSPPFLGVFDVPEVSFRCRTLKLAEELMKRYNQQSIWCWGKSDIKENKDVDRSTNTVKQ